MKSKMIKRIIAEDKRHSRDVPIIVLGTVSGSFLFLLILNYTFALIHGFTALQYLDNCLIRIFPI